MLYISYIIFYIIIILYSYLFYPIADTSLVHLTPAPHINPMCCLESIKEITLPNAEIPETLQSSFLKKHEKTIMISCCCIFILGLLFYYREDLITLMAKKQKTNDLLTNSTDISQTINSVSNNSPVINTNPILNINPMPNPPASIINNINISHELTSIKEPPIYYLTPDDIGVLHIIPHKMSLQAYTRCTEYLLTIATEKTKELSYICEKQLPCVLNLSDIYLPECLNLSTWSKIDFLTVLYHDQSIVELSASKVHLFTITKALYYMLSIQDKNTIIDAYRYLFF